MIWSWWSLSRYNKCWSNSVTMLASALLVKTTLNAKFRSTTEWFSAVSWRDFWIRFQWELRAKSIPWGTSIPRCQTCICSWDNEQASSTLSRFRWTLRPRRHKMTSTLFVNVSSLVSWIMTITVKQRKRRCATRTKCHREFSTCSKERLLKRWFHWRKVKEVPSERKVLTNHQWLKSEDDSRLQIDSAMGRL